MTIILGKIPLDVGILKESGISAPVLITMQLWNVKWRYRDTFRLYKV